MSKLIGDILVEKGCLTRALVDLALDSQKFYGGRIGSLLVELGAIDEKVLVEALCTQKGAKPAKAGFVKNVSKATLDLIPVKIATRYQVLPLGRDNRRLTVAITDPNDLLAIDELSFVTGCVIEPLLISEGTLLNALERYYGVKRTRPDSQRFEGLRNAFARQLGGESSAPPIFSQVVDTGDEEEASEGTEFWHEEPEADEVGPAATAVVESEEEAKGDTTAGASRAPTLRLDDEEIADGNKLLVPSPEETTELSITPPPTLEDAARRLAKVEIRDEIAEVIQWCTDGLFARSALFIFQKERTIGWTGQGLDLTPQMVRKVVVPNSEVSIFTLVRDTPNHYQGPLPENATNDTIVKLLGGKRPPAVLVVPFGIKGRAIGCFYAEDTPEELADIDLQMLFRLVQKAGLALEMLLLRAKIGLA